MTEITMIGENGGLLTWGWEIATYLFLGGLAAGLLIFSGAMRLGKAGLFRRSLLVADAAGLPLLGVGMLFLFVDLSNKLNVWRLYTTFQLQSPMSWGAWILLLTMAVLALRFVGLVPEPRAAVLLGLRLFPAPEPQEEGEDAPQAAKPAGLAGLLERAWTLLAPAARWINRWDRGLAIAGIVLGVGVGFYTGILLSSFPSRPLWNTAVLAPLFLISALGSAGAFLCLFLPHDEHLRLLPFSLLTCLVELLLLAAFVLNLVYGTQAAQHAGAILFAGGYGWAFWGLVLVLGLLLPAALEQLELLNVRVPLLRAQVPPLFKLAGGLALRFVIVYAGMLSFM